MVTVQLPVPEQAPDQPEKLEPLAAVAVRVTSVPSLKDALSEVQESSQSMPEGLEVTAPEPVPDLLSERVNWFGAGVVKDSSAP